MRREPTPRHQAYDLYWYFAAERQRVFNSRVAGEPGPWSQDAILEEFKFCNVFRASDRVSQYLIREVAYGPQAGMDADALFRIVAFRTFSRTSTWDAICEFLGRPPIIDDLTDVSLRLALEHARAKHGGLYTGAFILCANDAYGQRLKYLNHLELFRHMFVAESLGERLLDAGSLQEIYSLLHDFPLMGDFMSYQTAIDLNYSDLVNFDENDFTQPGPGALRGIAKCFESVGDYKPAEVIQWMVDRQEIEFDRLGIDFTGLWGRRLHAIDCQGLFCETDKYCRIALPQLASARKRMKAKFKPSSESLELFFPPKWGINDDVPPGLVLGSARDYDGQPQLV
jgi:hypothetical protein